MSPRERQVLRLMAEGLTNKEIARELHIGLETVKSHVKAICADLYARNRTHAVTRGIRTGVIS